MEQCFRIVLSMLLLVGYLQAIPVDSTTTKPSCSMNQKDLGLDLLRGASCEKDVTFTSPTNTEEKCYMAALLHFKKQLEHAEEKCDKADYIDRTLAAWNLDCWEHTKCNLTLKTHGQFDEFITATESFVQQLEKP